MHLFFECPFSFSCWQSISIQLNLQLRPLDMVIEARNAFGHPHFQRNCYNIMLDHLEYLKHSSSPSSSKRKGNPDIPLITCLECGCFRVLELVVQTNENGNCGCIFYTCPARKVCATLCSCLLHSDLGICLWLLLCSVMELGAHSRSGKMTTLSCLTRWRRIRLRSLLRLNKRRRVTRMLRLIRRRKKEWSCRAQNWMLLSVLNLLRYGDEILVLLRILVLLSVFHALWNVHAVMRRWGLRCNKLKLWCKGCVRMN
jgi:hypothetical protein